MLSKDAQKKLLQALKYTDEQITDLLGEGEKDITIPEGIKVFSSDDMATMRRNIENSAEVKNKHREILIKEMKDKAGLEFEGKDPDKFIEMYKSAIMADSNTSIDDKIKAKDKTIADMKASLIAAQEKANGIEGKYNELTRDTRLMKMLPKDLGPLSQDDYLMLLKARVEIKDEDGNEVAYYKGQKLQDDKFNPLSLDKAIDHVFTTENWKAPAQQQQVTPQGRGGGDGGKALPGTITKMSEFRETYKDKGSGWFNGQEAQTKLAEITKGNNDFIFD